MNVEALINKYGKTVTLKEYAAGTLARGVFQSGVETSSQIIMFIHPAEGKTIQQLSEGIRHKTVMTGYSYDEISAGEEGGSLSDRITDGSNVYDVHQVQFWESNNINVQPFYVCTLIGVDAA